MATTFAGSKYTKPKDLDILNTGSDEEEEESAESGSTSSFSLQECINEFRARRIRRVSTHSRDMAGEEREREREPVTVKTAVDADLINQNRCNKEQERKCKPCKNGFCYCFTSDSGDCASTAPTREPLVRQHRRSRRSESHKTATNNTPAAGSQHSNNLDCHQQRHRQSLPSHTKKISCKATKPLTVISSLNAVTEEAPLIHIIQELRNNCVISEVRVNRQKLQTSAPAAKPSEMLTAVQSNENDAYQPTAPPLSCISEKETPTEDGHSQQSSLVGGSLQSSRRSSLKSSRRSSGGRLLQKRLSHGQVNFKMHDTKYPPPKPPRRATRSLDANFSLSSLTSTTPSVREAERVVDEFLRQRGVQLPSIVSKAKSKRKSYPLAEIEKTDKNAQRRQLPTCPSLSDIERVMESKRGTHYAKNIHNASSLHRKDAVADKPMKQVVLGWTEPKINDMLNYDTKFANVDGDKPNRHKFKTQAPSAEPQSAIGWQAPHKISLDTVDGVVSENLAANIEDKHTPIKYPRTKKSTGGRENQKFIWGEQWRNLSPWNPNKRGHMSAGLRTKSKKFFNNSKNKILRFVSPKKTNQPNDPASARRLCTVGVQTSQLDLHVLQSQSPPGSYHSPVQSCTTIITPSASAETTSTLQHPLPRLHEDSFKQLQFDFERKVKPPTPPKKLPRAQRARKLDFNFDTTLHCSPATYRSYHKDIDQDVTITKMGYLLSSIKAKLEASDERAMRTFQECSRFEPLQRAESVSFDCPDGRRVTQHQRHELNSEPIYSEIEEDCVHIRGSPQFESRTAAVTTVSTTTHTSRPTLAPEAQYVTAPDNVSVLYARVQKPPKKQVTQKASEPTSLGQFLQESFRNGSFFQFMPLPDEPVNDNMSTLPVGSHMAQQELSAELQSVPTPPLPMPILQSLNNIHEQHSPPKKHQNLSKSDLSLQRSEIFLENLCRSEILLDHDDNMRLEKVENVAPLSANTGGMDSECVSYDLPLDSHDGFYQQYSTDGDESSFVTNEQPSQYGSDHIEPLSSENQSTPKKQAQIFTTKLTRALSIDTGVGQVAASHNLSNSCPTTPQQIMSYSANASAAKHTHSLGELTQTPAGDSQMLSTSALARYRHLKDALRRSYRKGKNFFKAETQRLASSLGMPRDQSNQTEGELDSSTYYASIQLDRLMNEALSPNEQLAHAVNICRQMPELEISVEMVEAERLLLFSSLRSKTQSCSEATMGARRQAQCFLIDAMHLPVKSDANQDMFFNSYYICTFECEGRISSTQSVECQNGAAVFRDCGIEFYSSGQAEAMQLRCQIFMLRLRKVSTLSLEPQKTLVKRKSLESANGSSCSSNGESIVSRFRLHASFVLSPSDLVPYELVTSETENSPTMCLRASRCWQLPIISHTKFINLAPQIRLTGRVELRLPKFRYAGYLNVQDTKMQHNWNRRWCTLVGLQLAVWQHEENLTEQPPLLAFMLQHCQDTVLNVAPREVCARLRSFLINCDGLQICFAADTQSDLTEWLLQLNEALKFVNQWINPCPSRA